MEEPDTLATILSDSNIRAFAGTTYYQRGVDYFQHNRVTDLAHSGDALEAVVRGTEDYSVRFVANGQRFEYTCECPLGDEGVFCKHCVAAALAWLADRSGSTGKTARSSPCTDKDIEAVLAGQEKEKLIATLLEWSQRDKVLRERLVLMVRAKSSPGDVIGQVRAQVEKAIKIRGFIEYDQASGYQSRVESALEAVQALIEQGHAAAAIELCESSMKWLEAAAENIDDSDGQITELMELVARLHLQACEQARPDPAALGVRLFLLEMNGEYGQWAGASENYAHLLGEQGLAAFRAAAEKAWAKVPTRTDRENYSASDGYYGVTRIMESLARRSGDVEQLVIVLERNLTFAQQYLRIAQAYRDAARHEKALDWAERGVALYPSDDGRPLRLFVAEEYRRNERHADALRLVWSEFRGAPSLENYKLLESFARAADDWADWRDRAIALVRRGLADKASAIPAQAHAAMPRWQRNQGCSLLVEIFLYEGNIQEAWAEANAGGCRDELWLQLASARGTTHPEDAVAVYLRIGEQTAAAISNGRYEDAVELFEQAASLMHRLGRSEDFEVQFDALRHRLRLKRNLQKRVETRRAFLYLR